MRIRRTAVSVLLVGWLCAAPFAPAGAEDTVPRNHFAFTKPDSESRVRSISVAAQEKTELDLRMSFAEATVGGGVVVTYDPAVIELTDVAFDDGSLGDDPGFRCPGGAGPIRCPENAAFLSFGSVTGIAGGTTGERRVATLEFTGVAGGSSPIGFSVMNSFSDLAGDAITVPEPALQGPVALAALALLSGRRRRSGFPRPPREAGKLERKAVRPREPRG